MGVKCKKSITKNTFAIWHDASFSFSVDSLSKPRNKFYEFKKESIIKCFRKDIEDEYRTWGVTDDELKRYKKGEDVYFGYERFKELINSNK